MSKAHEDGLYVAPNVLWRIVVTDGGEAYQELVYVQPGGHALTVNRMPCPREHLADIGAMLARAGECAP